MFRGKYLKNLPHDFAWQKMPIQIYPLSSVSNFFQLPTPLLRIDYNFFLYIKEGAFTLRIGNVPRSLDVPPLGVHKALAILLIAFLIGHIGGVINHYVKKKENTLNRILP